MERVTNHIGEQFKALLLQITDAKKNGLDTTELEAKKQKMIKLFGS
jgi:hypothetical protein